MSPKEPKPLLQALGLRLSLPGRDPVTFDLRVGGGEAVQLCGPSGCGKTTALRMLARLDDPGPAQLSLDGAAPAQVDPQAWRRQVCYLAQRPTMLPGTVADNLRAGFGVRHAPEPPAGLEQRNGRRLERLGLHPDRIHDQDARTLSGGEAARVGDNRVRAVGLLEGPLQGTVEYGLGEGGEFLREHGLGCQPGPGFGIGDVGGVDADGHRLVVSAPEHDGTPCTEQLFNHAIGCPMKLVV